MMTWKQWKNNDKYKFQKMFLLKWYKSYEKILKKVSIVSTIINIQYLDYVLFVSF